MLGVGSYFEIADNSGAREGQCIRILGGGGKKYGVLGSFIVLVVKKAAPDRRVKKSEIYNGIIVRTKQPFRRKDGSMLRFDKNSVVLLTKKNVPIGTRIYGPVPRELRLFGFMRIISLSPVAV